MLLLIDNLQQRTLFASIKLGASRGCTSYYTYLYIYIYKPYLYPTNALWDILIANGVKRQKPRMRQRGRRRRGRRRGGRRRRERREGVVIVVLGEEDRSEGVVEEVKSVGDLVAL